MEILNIVMIIATIVIWVIYFILKKKKGNDR